MQNNEPHYIKLYLRDICILRDIPKSLQDTLFLVSRKLDLDGMVSLTDSVRERICKELKIKKQTLRDRIKQLKKAGILHKDKSKIRNEYLMNPYILAKGFWSDVKKQRARFEIKHSYDEITGKKTTIHYYVGGKEKVCNTLDEVFLSEVNEEKQKGDNILAQKDAEIEKLKKQLAAKEKNLPTEVNSQEEKDKFFNDVESLLLNKLATENIDIDNQELINQIKTYKYDFTSVGNIGAYLRYGSKAISTYLQSKNATKYKTTIERLTDYEWAEHADFNGIGSVKNAPDDVYNEEQADMFTIPSNTTQETPPPITSNVTENHDSDDNSEKLSPENMDTIKFKNIIAS